MTLKMTKEKNIYAIIRMQTNQFKNWYGIGIKLHVMCGSLQDSIQ